MSLIGLIRTCLLSLALLNIAGCATVKDVSTDRVLCGGYAPNQLYISKVEIAVIDAGGPVDGFCLDRNGPDISALYHGQPVLQVLPIGTKLRIVKVLHVIVRAPANGESYTVVVVSTGATNTAYQPLLMMGGSLSICEVVKVKYGWNTIIQKPDPQLITAEASASK